MGSSSSPASTFLLIALMVVAFYFLIIRPNKKRQQAQQKTMSSLTPGTRVLLTSGVFATIVELGERQAVLEISPGVHLTVLKQAIARAVLASDEDGVSEDDFTDTADHETFEDTGALDAPRAPTPSTPEGGSHVAPTFLLDGDGTRHPVNPDQVQEPRTGISTNPIKD